MLYKTISPNVYISFGNVFLIFETITTFRLLSYLHSNYVGGMPRMKHTKKSNAYPRVHTLKIRRCELFQSSHSYTTDSLFYNFNFYCIITSWNESAAKPDVKFSFIIWVKLYCGKKKNNTISFSDLFILHIKEDRTKMEKKVSIIVFSLWAVIISSTNAKHHLHQNKVSQENHCSATIILLGLIRKIEKNAFWVTFLFLIKINSV